MVTHEEAGTHWHAIQLFVHLYPLTQAYTREKKATKDWIACHRVPRDAPCVRSMVGLYRPE